MSHCRTMSDNASTTIIAPLDAVNLRAQGLLRQSSSSESPRLHKRRLNRSSDEENHHIPLQIPQGSSAMEGAFVTIPKALISRQTLIHVGLSPSMADEIWGRWTDWPVDGPRREVDADDGGLQVTFFDFLVGRATGGSKPDTTGEGDTEWYECLDACGIAPDTQAAIMDPNFTILRLSRSCLDWVRDTIEMRYAGLQDIQRASRQREMELGRGASRPGSSTGGSSAGAGRGDGGRRSISGLQQQGMASMAADVWEPARAAAARNAPGFTVLYKGIDQGRISSLFGEDGTLSDIDALLSSPLLDFSGRSPLFYFTPDVKVAEYYAAYAKRCTTCESVVMVVLRIPNAAIEGLAEPDIQRLHWPSSAWKQMIWHGRNGKRLPKHLRVYKDAILTIGSISRKPNHVYGRLAAPEDITEDFVLKLGADGQPASGGSIATQFVISGEEEGFEWLTENGGKDIQVFPYPQAELARLVSANRP
ncbi:hypothetical protein B0T25DRAFT_576400 [Lasiosphaeria hispida]|uniref:Uncharacterized protein n=1 Tax=Lasiosphaeria hispida TaxID=260671 RepID=A0AAJ0HW14_9PEZI|nr:hypothetical protein B0T25DRAFT_576400 [Lasiosphaeria hispida]